MTKSLCCPCLTVKVNKEGDVLNQFEEIRRHCAALREILLPDEIWTTFRESAMAEFDAARHGSMLLSAFKDDCLHKITSPIHKFLLVAKKIKNGYIQELKENWLEANVLRRHQRFRGDYGKVIELLIAEWLENQGWKITNLEATCGNADIEASSPENIPHDIEIKYIGTEDDKFLSIVSTRLTKEQFSSLEEDLKAEEDDREKRKKIEESFRKADSGTFDPYSGANFILFKAYEAAKQLQRFRGGEKRKMAIIVISSLS